MKQIRLTEFGKYLHFQTTLALTSEKGLNGYSDRKPVVKSCIKKSRSFSISRRDF